MIDVEGALGHLTQLSCDNKDAKAAVAVRELEANHKYLCREVEEQRSLISELRRENKILKEDCERLRDFARAARHYAAGYLATDPAADAIVSRAQELEEVLR